MPKTSQPRTAGPTEPGFYKIVTAIDGLRPWTQYFDGKRWHGPSPPNGAKVFGPGPEAQDEDEDEEQEKEQEAAARTPNIQVDGFRCGTCGSSELGKKDIKTNGVVTYEFFCSVCEAIIQKPRLPLVNAGKLIIDSAGYHVAKIECFSEDDRSNAELARMMVAALNAWADLTQLVDQNTTGISGPAYARLVKRVKDYRGLAAAAKA